MKTKMKSLIIIAFLSFSMFLAVTSSASAQAVVPGVSKGETFVYSYSLIWTSTDASATPPSDLVEYNNTQRIEFRITDVSGSEISVDFIRIFNNGTQTVQSGSINVESGTVTVPYGFLIVGANLNKDQQVYPTGGHQVITDTVMRSYASGQRETNVMSGGDSSDRTTINFDKIKGVAVNYSNELQDTSGGYTIVSTESLTNTNSDVWTVIPEFPSMAVFMALLIAVPIVLVAYRKKALSNHKFVVLPKA
jgi:hypothetical protein